MPLVTKGRRLLPSIHDDSIFGAAPASAQYIRPNCGSTTTDVGDSRPVLMSARRYRPSVLPTITRPRGFEPERSVSVQYRLVATQSTATLVGFELPAQQKYCKISCYCCGFEDCLLGCNVIQYGRYVLTFQRNILLPSSGQRVIEQTTMYHIPQDNNLQQKDSLTITTIL
jgi:hypothetical protein